MKKIYKTLIASAFIIILLIGKNVQAEETYDTLTSALDGKYFEFENITEVTKDENGIEKTLYYYDKFDKKVIDSDGVEVSGNYVFSDGYSSPMYGYNYIKYTFYPNLPSYGDKKYKEFSGNFVVKYTKAPTIRIYSNKISVLVQIKNYRIEVNGKDYNKITISNLTPNTKYKVKIYQRANDNMEETLLYTKTVKTKSK